MRTDSRNVKTPSTKTTDKELARIKARALEYALRAVADKLTQALDTFEQSFLNPSEDR